MPNALRNFLLASILCSTSSVWAITGWIAKVEKQLSTPTPAVQADTPEIYMDIKSDLRLGNKHKALGLLKKQWLFEDTSDTFDDTFQTWLRETQDEKGLEPTGVLDRNTWFALYQQPAQWQAKEYQYALDTWTGIAQKHADHASDLMVIINIPAMELTVHQRQSPGVYRVILVSRVVVGLPNKRTPMDSFELVSLKYNPNWTPTPSMLRDNVYKGGGFNAAWLKKKGVQAIDKNGKRVNFSDIENPRQYRYSQPAGARNALGQLKFETTSGQNIYLHDTNEPNLYKHNVRAYSSGCVRVEDYLGLASILSGLTDDEIVKKIDVPKTYFEKIPTRVPVYFDDSQVRVLGDGTLGFSANVYGRK